MDSYLTINDIQSQYPFPKLKKQFNMFWKLFLWSLDDKANTQRELWCELIRRNSSEFLIDIHLVQIQHDNMVLLVIYDIFSFATCTCFYNSTLNLSLQDYLHTYLCKRECKKCFKNTLIKNIHGSRVSMYEHPYSTCTEHVLNWSSKWVNLIM